MTDNLLPQSLQPIDMQNDNLVLISGETGTGKSTSLMALANDSGIMYLNCESGKKLPFKNKFLQTVITDPMDVYKAFEEAEDMPEIHTIVIDTLTFLMDMFESVYVMQMEGYEGWKAYQQYFKNLMSQYVAKSTKNVIILAHTKQVYNKEEMVNQVLVPVKGALANNGIESFFSTVISTKKVLVKDLKNHNTPLLVITEDDEDLGLKRVFQTRLTKDTINERIRGPVSMWSRDEVYIDNNIGHVLNRLKDFYEDA